MGFMDKLYTAALFIIQEDKKPPESPLTPVWLSK